MPGRCEASNYDVRLDIGESHNASYLEIPGSRIWRAPE